LAIAILGVREWEALLWLLLLFTVVVVVIRDRQIGRPIDVHLFFRCEPGDVGTKETEMGYEADGDDKEDGGCTGRDNDNSRARSRRQQRAPSGIGGTRSDRGQRIQDPVDGPRLGAVEKGRSVDKKSE